MKKILIAILIITSESILASPVYNFNFYNDKSPGNSGEKKIEVEKTKSTNEATLEKSDDEIQPKRTEGFIEATGKVVRGVRDILTPENGPELLLSYVVRDLESTQEGAYFSNGDYFSSWINSIGLGYQTAKTKGRVSRHRFGFLFSQKHIENFAYDENSGREDIILDMTGYGLTYDYCWYFPVSGGVLSHFIIEQGVGLNYFSGSIEHSSSYEADLSPNISDSYISDSYEGELSPNISLDNQAINAISGSASLKAGLELAAGKLKMSALFGLGYSHYLKNVDVDNLLKDSEFDVNLTLRLGLEI